MAGRVVMVYLDVPCTVGNTELIGYVEDALDSWGGQYHPDDHLFGDKSTKVISVGKAEFQVVGS